MSLAKGKGKTIEDDKKKATWEDNTLEIFLKLCVKEVRAGNRPTTCLDKHGWINVQQNFNKITKREYDRKQMKNKWDSLKKEWQLWNKLIGKETGLGWNNIKKTIDASDEWWDRKIKEIPAAAKFREKGLMFVEEMEIVFGDVVATGAEAYTPASGVLPDLGGGPSIGVEEDAINLERSDESDDMRDTFPVFNQSFSVFWTPMESPTGTPLWPETDTQVEEGMPKVPRGKKRTEFTTRAGSSKKKHSPVQAVSSSLEKLVTVFDNHKTKKFELEEKYSAKRCLAIIKELPIENGSKLYFDCMRLVTASKDVRRFFLDMEDRQDQLGYLKNMVAELK